MLIDTHCHLTHERYEGDVGEVLSRARAAGVGVTVAVASDLGDAARIRQLQEEVSQNTELDPEDEDEKEAPSKGGLYRTAGVHPHHAGSAPGDLETRLLEELSQTPAPVAVGECGLDFYYDLASPRDQYRVFQTHLDVAARTGLPVVVHCRDAEDEMAGYVREAGESGVEGVLHCFPGDLDLMETALEAGWLVSFTGLVTFSSFQGVEAVRAVPSDRYMLETDGPYMAPVPHRGRRNEPGYVPFIRDRVAELRSESPSVVEAETTRTARRFFRLSH
jgi:TatD DNase family protein